jgi:RNA polymerase sigma-70 factor (ECF subfamily)
VVTGDTRLAHDSSLLRAARTDAEAFASFYRRWAPALHAWLRTQVPADAAGDLTAEAFAQALLGLGRFRGSEPGAGVAWLWGIARNLVRQHHRRARLERTATARLGIDAHLGEDVDWDDVAARAHAAALAHALTAELTRLDAGQRRALELRILSDLDFGAVSECLGISGPAARMRVSRALEILRSRLEGVWL